MIGKNIREIRKRRGLTLSELAERADIAKSYLSNIERNVNQNPSIHILEKVAGVLEVDIQELLGNQSYNKALPEEEWLTFIKELKETGIEKEDLDEYRRVIEFIKWQNQRMKKTEANGEKN